MWVLAVLLGGALAAACEGDNLFQNGGDGTGAGGVDSGSPGVQIQLPDSGTTVPIGDSIRVEAQLTDEVGIQSVRLIGVALRGDPTLGTDEAVVRFQEKGATFDPPHPDTLLPRYLLPTAVDTTEPAYIIVEATDAAGNLVGDTTVVLVGAPKVDLLELADTVPAGGVVKLRIMASDQAGISRVQLDYTGVAEGQISWPPIQPAQDSVLVDSTFTLPDTTGTLTLVASAFNGEGIRGRDTPVEMVLVNSAQADTVAPSVALDVETTTRMELLDSVRINVRAEDDNRGTGLVRVGYSAVASTTSGREVLIAADSQYATARVGLEEVDFTFPIDAITDDLALPDTLTLDVHGYAIDDAANCGAGVETEPQSLPCADSAGSKVAANIGGQRRETVAVTGYTVRLPDGGDIADAALDVDTTEARYRLYLSNRSNNQLEVLRLSDSTFVGKVDVGAAPWGLFMERSRDTLLVANSGGTNISFVPLQTGGDPDAVPQEELQRRLLTPNAVLYEFQVQANDAGAVTYTVYRHDFSDRPQFIAQDSTGRFLYSTVPTEAAEDGTLRLVNEDPDPGSAMDLPEARILFDETKALTPAENYTAIANIDSLVVNADPAAGDVPSVCDHEPGYPSTAVCIEADYPTFTIDDALDSLRTVTGDDRILARSGMRWVLGAVGMSDTTYVAASGNRGTIAFGEGATAPTGRVILWHAHPDPDSAHVSDDINIEDLVNNASERVRGVGLNDNGTLGVARGEQAAYFFDEGLRLQGEYISDLGSGGAGAALHPSNDQVKEQDPAGTQEHALSFVGTSDRSIKLVGTVHFNLRGEIEIRDNIVGSLRVSHPLPTDNGGQGSSCTGQDCIVAKLYGVTSGGGVVIINVRRRDITS